MPTDVLATKLYVPAPRPLVVGRPRLLEHLNGQLTPGRKVTLACAPAGFGKTTMLSEWAAHSRRQNPEVRVAWLSLDDGDNDPSRFLMYVVAALQGLEANIGSEAMSLLHSTQMPPVEAVLTSLINDVSGAGRKIILVLDDYHVIEAGPVHEALGFLLDHLPPGLHLAISSRSDPPLSLARLRARGELTELRASDLRFTADEAADFLNRVMALGLSTDDIAALESRTEGWIAGLQLAALSMRDHQDVAGFIRAFTGSHRFVIDYLVQEVLQHQSEEVRSFLLHTAVLDRLTAPLCEALTGVPAGRGILESLERDNLFVVPLDDSRQWYRYHHLFADVLRSRLLNEHPDRVAALHHSASEWYERNALPEEAVRHALAAADYGRAAELMESALPEMRRRRQDTMLLHWLTSLPEDVLRNSPVLSVFNAWRMLVGGNLDAVEPWLRNGEQALAARAGGSAGSVGGPSGGEELRNLPATIAMYRASHSQALGDVEATAKHARHGLELTAPGDHLGRAGTAGFLGLASWAAGDLETAVETFFEAVKSMHAAGNLADELGGAVILADMWMARGRLRTARQLYQDALELASTHEGDHIRRATVDLHTGISELHCELGDPEAAGEHLQAAARLRGSASPIEHGYRHFVALARVSRAEGDLDQAIELLTEAERLYVPGFTPVIRPIPAIKARIRILQGKLSEAWEWERERNVRATDNLSYLHEFEHLTLARLLIGQYRADGSTGLMLEAVTLLDRLLSSAEASKRNGSVNEILILLALALDAQGSRPLALVPLKRALVQAGAEGYVRLFLDEGEPMAALLREAPLEGDAADHAGLLMRAWTAPDGASVTAPRRNSGPSLEALSAREYQVLRLLDTPLSGPEIARDLFVSLNTLRTHTRHIFAKLEVNSRRSAVNRAKERGLL